MVKLYPICLFFITLSPSYLHGQTIKAAIEHIEILDKSGDVATKAFLEYAGDCFLNKKEKSVAKRNAKMQDIIKGQEEKIADEKPFNGQMRLKNGYTNFLIKLRQFPENLGPYSELTIEDYQKGLAQKKKQAIISQLEILKTANDELNLEVVKYITMNKLRDFKQGSVLPPKWEKVLTIFTYCHKIQEAVMTVAAMERDFHDAISRDSLEKAEEIRKAILQNSATMAATVKIRPPVPTDFTLREAAVNSFNLYRLDAFRNFKSVIDARKKELAFKQKYPTGAAKTEALKAKFEAEKLQLESELSGIRNTIKELKKDRDKHEKAFDDYLIQFLERWSIS